MTASRLKTVAIVGGGLAAAEAAATLRGEGFDGRLSVVAAEPHLPYERPPLSKEYLRGEVGLDALLAREPAFYERERIELLTGRPAVSLDVRGRRLTLDSGRVLPYDALILATGARAVRPPIEGPSSRVFVLRTIADADRLREASRGAGEAIVAGGGWIAAETAASLVRMGLRVTLVIPGREILERHLGSEVGGHLTALHERNGVRVVRRARVVGVEDGPRSARVRLADGRAATGDIVVLGFGAAPEMALAAAAGLPIGDGVLVDDRLRTPAPGVFAAGDVASVERSRYGGHIRSEHWDDARRQGRTAARNVLGRDESYDRVPYFFSDQYDLGLEVIGRAGARSDVHVRDEGDGGLLAFWLDAGRVVAGMHANVPDAKPQIVGLVSAGLPLDLRLFSDPAVPFAVLGTGGEVAAASAGRGDPTTA